MASNHHLLVLVVRCCVYLGFAWGAVSWRRWQKRRRETIAQAWPSVEAIILSGEVTTVSKTSCFVATLRYTYFVGEYRTGSYVHEFARETDADDFVRHLRDKRLPIRYNESNPDNSLLEQSVVEQHAQATPASHD
jgi:hypothetical protein